MKFKTGIIVFAGILLFAIFIALAIAYESAFLLYGASVVPFLLVPFLPDLPGNQWLVPGNKGRVAIYRTEAAEETDNGLIIIDFAPGTIHWGKRRLFFSIDGIPTAFYRVPEIPGTATMSVLPYDLLIHPRKKNCYGIQLKNLQKRSASFSFTTDEIGRFIIRAEDLQQLHSSRSVAQSGTLGKGLGA